RGGPGRSADVAAVARVVRGAVRGATARDSRGLAHPPRGDGRYARGHALGLAPAHDDDRARSPSPLPDRRLRRPPGLARARHLQPVGGVDRRAPVRPARPPRPLPAGRAGRRASAPPAAPATAADGRPRRERVIGWLLLAVALVFGVPACAFLSQDRMLFLPHLAARPGMRPPRAVEEVEFATPEGPRLRGWFAPARGGGPAPLIVYYGGNAGGVTGRAVEPGADGWGVGP